MLMGTLGEALAGLPDRRTRKGRRYSLASIILLALAGMLSGANDLLAIHRFGKRLPPKALEALGITRRRVPAHATLHYVFRSLAAADLERALRGLVQAANGLGHVAIDGKTLRGSRQAESRGVHMLQAFSTRLSAMVGSLIVPPDSAEMLEALALIKSLPLAEGDVASGDAAFAYGEVVKAIRDKGADYFLFVKGNQPELQAEIAHAFGDDSPLQGRCRARPRRPPG
jgi:hypothetical protein